MDPVMFARTTEIHLVVVSPCEASPSYLTSHAAPPSPSATSIALPSGSCQHAGLIHKDDGQCTCFALSTRMRDWQISKKDTVLSAVH
jgi:hypothetical protein